MTCTNLSTQFRVTLSNREETPLPFHKPERFGLPSWAASVAQPVDHLHSMQDVAGLSPS